MFINKIYSEIRIYLALGGLSSKRSNVWLLIIAWQHCDKMWPDLSVDFPVTKVTIALSMALFFKCICAPLLWKSILDWFGYSGPLVDSQDQLFESWRMGVGLMWKLSFLAMIWTIWKERNECCFEGRSSDYWHLVERVRFRVALWIAPLSQFRNIPLVKMCISPRWIPPPVGVYKPTFDKSDLGNPGMATIGRRLHSPFLFWLSWALFS